MVGFGSADRFEGGAETLVYPGLKTVICAVFRTLRGAYRGVEYGTTYYQYTTMAVETLEENVMPIALLKCCALIEDAGFGALPQRRHPTVIAGKHGTNPEADYTEIMRGRFTEVQADFDKLAVNCGLGEIGRHGGLITRDFGPMVRICAILTDAEIEPDDIQRTKLCDGCAECARACPGGAIYAAGVNDWQCAAYYMGAGARTNPFMPPDAFANDADRRQIMDGSIRLTPERARDVIDQILFYPPVKHGYAASICGRACYRACYAHLEARGALKRRFENPMRRRPEWELRIQE